MGVALATGLKLPCGSPTISQLLLSTNIKISWQQLLQKDRWIIGLFFGLNHLGEI